MEEILIRRALEEDTSIILGLIRELAQYERLENEVVANEVRLRSTLFGAPPAA